MFFKIATSAVAFAQGGLILSKSTSPATRFDESHMRYVMLKRVSRGMFILTMHRKRAELGWKSNTRQDASCVASRK